MTSAAVYASRAREAQAHADHHDALAMQGNHGEAGHHRAAADAYRSLATALTKLALHVDGGGE